MKNLLTISTLVFTLMFSSTSFADWTKVTDSEGGDTYYVDFERIRKHDGYLYYWDLTDFLKPDKYGYLSVKTYNKVDCKLLRYSFLSIFFHKEPMGRGDVTTQTLNNTKWTYNPPNSTGETILKSVCSR